MSIIMRLTNSPYDNTNLVAAFLLWDSISCFRQSIPSIASGSDSAPPLLGNVADGSRREDASPLSLPGPFTDSDSEPCGSNQNMNGGEEVEKHTDGWMEWAAKQPFTAIHEKPLRRLLWRHCMITWDNSIAWVQVYIITQYTDIKQDNIGKAYS